MTKVTERSGLHVAKRLPHDEIRRLCGVDRPLIEDAFQAVGKINEELHRGESVCFPFYAKSGEGEPVGWYFVGNTVD